MNFIIKLRLELAIITNRSNLADLNEAEKIAKNMKSISLINKNILVANITLTVAKIKEFKIQILKLKAKLKESKYILWENRKLFINAKGNRKLLYKGSNCKLIDKRNLKYYK